MWVGMGGGEKYVSICCVCGGGEYMCRKEGGGGGTGVQGQEEGEIQRHIKVQ